MSRVVDYLFCAAPIAGGPCPPRIRGQLGPCHPQEGIDGLDFDPESLGDDVGAPPGCFQPEGEFVGRGEVVECLAVSHQRSVAPGTAGCHG